MYTRRYYYSKYNPLFTIARGVSQKSNFYKAFKFSSNIVWTKINVQQHAS